MTGANQMTTWPRDEPERIGAADPVTGPAAHRGTVRLVPEPGEE